MTDGTSDTGKTIEDPSEPSMEDILASIRQLIADDDSVASSGEGPSVVENSSINKGLGDNDIVATVASDPLDLDNPLDDQFIEQGVDASSGMALEEDAGLIEETLQIPEIKVASEDISLDDVLTNISNDFELEVPSEETTPLPSEDIVGDLMGDLLGNDSSSVMVEKVDADILSSAADDALNDDPQSSRFDAEIDGLLADIVGTEGKTNVADLVDFDQNSSDIDSILSDMSVDLAAAPEMAATVDSLVEPDVLSEIPSDIQSPDMSDIDSLLDEITGVDYSPELTAAATDSPTEKDPIAELSGLMDMLGDDLNDDNIALLPEMEEPEIVEPENTVSALDDLVADISAEEEILPSESEVPSETDTDPDIALVKSLMAELSAQSSFDDETDLAGLIDDSDLVGVVSETDVVASEPLASEPVASEPVENDAALSDMDDILSSVLTDTSDNNSEVLQAEGDIIEDLLEDTIEAEEQLQETLNNDLEAKIAELSSVLEEDSATPAPVNEPSNLSNLADKIQKSDGLNIGAVAVGASGAAVAGVSLTAAIASNSHSRKSALESLIDGLEETEIKTVEAPDVRADDNLPDVTNIDEGDPLSELVQAEIGDDLDVVSELGTELDVLDLKVTELEVPELDLPELDLVDEILEDEADQVVAVTPQTVQTKVETSQTETEDMAGKTARETILDEVTETAAASAFASLNQVVDEKNIVAERGDRIGDLVSEALKPMLKEWLDANLKTIVERAVTKEVKRISSGK